MVWLGSQAGKAEERQILLIKPTVFIETQNTLNTQRKLEKEKQTWRNQASYFRLHYKATKSKQYYTGTKQKYRSINRNKPADLWLPNL